MRSFRLAALALCAWVLAAPVAVAQSGPGDEPVRATSGRGNENLAAFARAYGYVRHFYPGDEAVAADWTAVAIAGVQRAEPATSPADLARRLEAVLRPVAPAFRAWPTDRPPPAAEALARVPGLRWRHEGFGQAERSIYRSERVPAEAGQPDLFTADLPGGVSVRLPLVVAVEAGHTLPAATADPVRPQKPIDFKPSGDDRATRLADVVIAWNVLQHFYPYFDLVPGDWAAELPKALSAAAVDADRAAFRRTLQRLVVALGDGHGAVVDANGRDPARPFGSLAVALAWIEDRAVVVAANDPGLRRGDVIARIDGRGVGDLIREAEGRVSGATPQWKRFRALYEITTGPMATPARLEGLRADGAAFAIDAPRVTGAPPREARPELLAELRPGYLYVDLDRITDGEIEAAWPRLADAKGVIFDLRGYPKPRPTFLSHLTDRIVTSPRWHVPVITRPDQQGVTWKTSNWTLRPAQPRIAGRIAFITDGRAMSYAESVLGLVEGERLAPIVGEPTAGTNGNVNPLVLPGGYTIRWTGMKVLKHDGSPHHGVGIQPTVPVRRTLAGIRAGRDEQLEAALREVGAPP